MSSEKFLDAAAAIGRRIAAHAVWHEGRCSWVGAAAVPADRSRPEYRPIGPLVYDGTAGVGLFLAQLATAIDDDSLRRTATGALRHALGRAPRGDGLYAGPLGIAWAAARAAAVLGEEKLAAGARDLATRRPAPPGRARCPDLMEGSAGAVVALLGLATALDEPSLVEQARATGEALLATAVVTHRGWSWEEPTRPYAHRLCGMAHGTSGIGWALLELFAVTGETQFRDGASGAFAYERSWLDRGSGTWPDLRLPVRGGAGVGAITATWCYGEAGIALSRLRALAILSDTQECSDADICLSTTRRHLKASLPFAIDDLSLCHGAAGAADALLAAGETEVATALGEVALERHGERGDWPCGVDGTTPGLFRGLSGIGWLYLRLHDPTVPSALILEPALDKPPRHHEVDVLHK